jgi:anti-sigma factor RsiW
MDCQQVQQGILESLDERRSPANRREIDAHVAGCPECARFAARQQAVDARLAGMLVPPLLSPAFRPALRSRIGREPATGRPEVLPDVVHFLSCGVATLLCAFLLPFAASVTVATGTTAALLTYVLLTSVRDSFEDFERPDR